MTRDVEWRPGVLTRLHASSGSGAAQLCVLEQRCEPGAGAPPHTHFEVEEVIVVLGGEAEFTVDGVTSCVRAGESIVLPAGSVHGFVNSAAGELHTVAVFASASPPVSYEGEPGLVLEVGSAGGERVDPHRRVRERR